MYEEITEEDIRKEFPNATQEQVELILIWVNNAYDAGHDKGADAVMGGMY